MIKKTLAILFGVVIGLFLVGFITDLVNHIAKMEFAPPFDFAVSSFMIAIIGFIIVIMAARYIWR